MKISPKNCWKIPWFFGTFFGILTRYFRYFWYLPVSPFSIHLKCLQIQKRQKDLHPFFSSNRNKHENFCFVLILHRLLWREFSQCACASKRTLCIGCFVLLLSSLGFCSVMFLLWCHSRQKLWKILQFDEKIQVFER